MSTQPAFAAGEGEEGLDQTRLLIVGGENLFGGGTPCVDRRGRVVQRNLEERALSGEGVRSSWEALATKCR